MRFLYRGMEIKFSCIWPGRVLVRGALSGGAKREKTRMTALYTREGKRYRVVKAEQMLREVIRDGMSS